MATATAPTKPARRRAPWRGRPRVADAKGKFIAVRVTERDRLLIAEMAAAAELSTGAFLRAVALGSAGARARKEPKKQREQLARLLGEIGKLGSNVNQIARWCNTDRTAPHLREAEMMRADVAAMRAAVMKALDSGD